MANSIAFSLRRLLTAVTLFSLPFFLLSDEFLILKIFVASYSVCLCLFANRSHIIPILKLFSCSTLGVFVVLTLGGYWRRPINEDALDLSLLGSVAGLAIGLTWVQYRRDVERFEAYIVEPDAFEEEIEEPSALRATLPVFFLILVFWAACNCMFSLAHLFAGCWLLRLSDAGRFLSPGLNYCDLNSFQLPFQKNSADVTCRSLQ